MVRSTLEWLMTFLVHSTVLLGVAWAVQRWLRDPRARELVWRGALFGAVFSATLATLEGSRTVTHANPVAGPPVEEYSVAAETWPVGLDSGLRPVPLVVPRLVDAPAIWAVSIWAAIGLSIAGREWRRGRRFLDAIRDRQRLTPDQVGSECWAAIAPPRSVVLSGSTQLTSPAVLSSREVCVPLRVLDSLEPRVLRSVLAHEYEHVARRDPWWRIAYLTLEAAFFFQPLTWVATRALRREAELVCDRAAVINNCVLFYGYIIV